MTELFTYIQLHWVEWIFAVISLVLGFMYRGIGRRLKEEEKKNTAIAATREVSKQSNNAIGVPITGFLEYY